MPTSARTTSGVFSLPAASVSHVWLTIFGIAAFIGIVLVKGETASEFEHAPLLFAYTIFVTTFQLSRVVAAAFYPKSRELHSLPEPFWLCPTGEPYEPTASFVIPCKNEERAIAHTVMQCLAAEYPKEKLEVIVVNDGSTDGTGATLRALAAREPRLTLIDWVVNRGKRHAMAEGFRRAKGEIVVQLDSDSYIAPHTFRALIDSFRDPQIGAVCAHADPANAAENWLTKMQAAYYFVSFRILKAAESTFATVFCCSGCSSAYRKSIVLPVLDEWLREKFLGLPVTWGDDRALTNRVLAAGYHTVYTDAVQAYTICPSDLTTFLKQQTRWKKGWFVNSLFASRFIVKREPFVAFTYFFPLIGVTLMTPFMALRALVWNPFILGVAPIFYVVGVFLVALIITLYYRALAPENPYWPYVFAWSAINMLVLSFILFYALTRLKDRRWGTR